MGGPKGGPMKLTACIILFLSLVTITNAIAQTDDNALSGPTGQWLLSLDENSRFYYIMGVSSGLAFTDEALDDLSKKNGQYDNTRSFLYTKRRNLTYGQIVAIVEKFLHEHPESWGYSASSLVHRALAETIDKMP